MVLAQKLLTPIQFNEAKSKQFSAENVINFYAEKNSTGEYNLYGRPGLTLFSNISSDPVYALYNWNNNVYAVIGNFLYKVDSSGGSTNLGTIGTVTNNIQIFDNSLELVIVNIYNGATYTYDTTNGLRQVDDPDFRNPTSGTFLDGYAIYSERDSNRWFISDLLNARAYDALDFTTADATSDNLLGVYATLKLLWTFSSKSIQIYQNVGDPSFPFDNLNGSTLQQGCASILSVQQLKNILFWLGEDGTVWSFDGSPSKISSPAIDNAISRFQTISDAFAFVFPYNGHNFYCLTFPTEERTFVFDLNERLWYDWRTFESTRWNLNCAIPAFNKIIVGDSTTGKLYYLDQEKYTDNGEEIIGQLVTPNYFNNTNDTFISRFEVRWEAGVGLLSGLGSNPSVILQKSTDGGITYGKEIWRNISRRGEYDVFKCIWHNLGIGSNVTYKITISDPVRRAIQGIYGTIRLGVT